MATSTLSNLIASSGYVRITWTNAEQPSNFYAWRLYHRRVGDSRWQKIYETRTVASSYTHDTYAWAIGVTQEIVLVGVSQNPTTGVLTEGAYIGANSFTYTAEAKYWLVHPTTPSMTMQFSFITEDEFKYEADYSISKLLDLDGEGGGRKVNVGSSYGRAGSIKTTLYNHTTLGTATAQRQKLLDLYLAGTKLWLRTPFGDMFPVYISEPSFTRVAGTGSMEAVEVQFEYAELSAGSGG